MFAFAVAPPAPGSQPQALPAQDASCVPTDDAIFTGEVVHGLGRAGWIVTVRHFPHGFICEAERKGTRFASECSASRKHAIVQVASRIVAKMAAVRH